MILTFEIWRRLEKLTQPIVFCFVFLLFCFGFFFSILQHSENAECMRLHLGQLESVLPWNNKACWDTGSLYWAKPKWKFPRQTPTRSKKISMIQSKNVTIVADWICPV